MKLVRADRHAPTRAEIMRKPCGDVRTPASGSRDDACHHPVRRSCGDCAETSAEIGSTLNLGMLRVDNAAQAWGSTRTRQKDLEQPRTTVKKDRLESYD